MINAMDGWLTLDKERKSQVESFRDAIDAYYAAVKVLNTFDGKYVDVYATLEQAAGNVIRDADSKIASVKISDITEQVRRDRALAEIKKFSHRIGELYHRFVDSLSVSKIVKIYTKTVTKELVFTSHLRTEYSVQDYGIACLGSGIGNKDLHIKTIDTAIQSFAVRNSILAGVRDAQGRYTIGFLNVNRISENNIKRFNIRGCKRGIVSPYDSYLLLYLATNSSLTDVSTILYRISMKISLNDTTIYTKNSSVTPPHTVVELNPGRYMASMPMVNFLPQKINPNDLITVELGNLTAADDLGVGSLVLSLELDNDVASDSEYGLLLQDGEETSEEEAYEEEPLGVQELFDEMREQFDSWKSWADNLMELDDPEPQP